MVSFEYVVIYALIITNAISLFLFFRHLAFVRKCDEIKEEYISRLKEYNQLLIDEFSKYIEVKKKEREKNG